MNGVHDKNKQTNIVTRANPDCSLAEQQSSEIIILLDRSGSMRAAQSNVINAFNGFLAEQQTAPNNCRVTLVQFNHEIETLTLGRPLEEIVPLNQYTYKPKGGTRLHDAVGRTIEDVSDRIDESLPAPYRTRVLCAIVTDGEDTDSKDYTCEDIERLIRAKRARSKWEFVFLGAVKDARSAGNRLGIDEEACVDIRLSGAGVQAAGALLSRLTTTFRESGTIKTLALQQSYR
jgi:uncharacterized protein YegL